jgi:hypothetical protein
MNKNQKQIMAYILMKVDSEMTIDEDSIKKDVDFFSMMHPINEDEKSELIKILHSKLQIRMDRGSYIKEKDHVTWYYSTKKDLDSKFWDRFIKYLYKYQGFSPDVVNALDASTDLIMDLLGNPSLESDFQRRGLVIGDVQSGKTATYTALINKAADSGYRIIILLTGTIEKLRQQTQGRLDEGFVGLDSTALFRDKSSVAVGVGKIDESFSGWSLTSTSSDFNKSAAERMSGRLAGINTPVLFVLKKNKSVLEKLEQWIRIYNTNPANIKCPLPMLLIDDEADNASVNTKADEDPAVINACIRKLLKLFNKANYVGFTATPFANIFINPYSDNEMLKEDLFPRDFIYALDAPSNYVGARSVFSNKGKYSYMLKNNDDCEEYLPENHKISFIPEELPDSLKESIVSFFIVNVVRDLRGQTTKHRSMLINISRFISVQDKIAKDVDAYVREMQREIKNYHLIGADALKYDTFSFIKKVFDKHFNSIPNFEYKWDDIQRSLHKAVASIVVRTVNGGNASRNLNYDEYEEEGLRLIAIGGFSLSRGLTLEGLCVSYFYRNSKMYDTLMQMGRWFGYRDGYIDLCQIWMSTSAIYWYEHISIASDELRKDVRRMQGQNKTPKEFGLGVRSSPEFLPLKVSASNKMKNSSDYIVTISLNGKMVETPYLNADKEILLSNLRSTENWIQSLASDGYIFNTNSDLALSKNPQVKNVPKQSICDYLRSYQSHYLNTYFHTDDIVELISRNSDGTLDNWDVIIASGEGDKKPFCGQEINYVSRIFRIRYDKKAIQINGSRSRLGDKNLAKGGLTNKEVKYIKSLYTSNDSNSDLSEDAYFKSSIERNPLLVIYPVQLGNEIPVHEESDNYKEEIKQLIFNMPCPLIGLSIGIPKINGMDNQTIVYKINKVREKEILSEFSGKDSELDVEVDETVNLNEGTYDG